MMSTVIHYPHLTISDDGVARIGDTRYKVLHLAAEHYHYGWSGEELLRHHPDLQPGEVYAALTYFYDHRDEMVDQIKAIADSFKDFQAKGPTRAECWHGGVLRRHFDDPAA